MAGMQQQQMSAGGQAVEDQRGALFHQRYNIKSIMATYMIEDPMEALFPGCVKKVLIPSRNHQGTLLEAMHTIFTKSPQEVWHAYLNEYVTFTVEQTNHQRVVYVLGVLSSLITSGTLPARLVCEVLLSHLNLGNEMTWREFVHLIRKLIGGVDYKGCRELLKALLTKFDHLPPSVPRHQMLALQQGKELLEYILDRNAALLPAYFALDELQRHYPDKSHSPHWMLEGVVEKLRSEMRITADVVSGIVQPYLLPVIGVSNLTMSNWILDPQRHCCTLKGLLPYREIFLKPQEDLLFYLISQPNSKDVIASILNLKREQIQPNSLVEDALVRLVVVAMELAERYPEAEEKHSSAWMLLANCYFVYAYLQLVGVASVLEKLRVKLVQREVTHGRSYLMWSLLYFFTNNYHAKSMSPTAWVQEEFVPIMNLYNLLYQDKEPLPVPNTSSSSCVYDCSMACLWLYYKKKAENENLTLPQLTPHIISKQIEWIEQKLEEVTSSSPSSISTANDYTILLLLNAYIANEKLYNILLDSTLPPLPPSPSSSSSSSPPRTPKPVWLNLLVMHAKIRVSDSFKTHLMKVAEAAKQVPQVQVGRPLKITLSLLETYGSILVWLGTRNFQALLIPTVFKSQAWGMLHALLETITYRVLFHIAFSSKFHLLQQLHTVANVNIIPSQLFLTAETTALQLIKGLSTPDFLTQLAKHCASDPKQLLSSESEELNRVFVLSIAQALQISCLDTHNWLESFMRAIMITTPHRWSESSLKLMPLALQQTLHVAMETSDAKQLLLSKVEDDFKRFKVKSSEQDCSQFLNDSSTASLCIVWKLLLETGSIPPVCIKVLQLMPPKKLATQLRKMVDYVVYSSQSNQQLNNAISCLNDMVWKYNIFPMDRLLLFMTLRKYEGTDAHMMVTIIQCLPLMSKELLLRVNEYVSEVPTDSWSGQDWEQRHTAYLKKYPESCVPTLPGANSPSKSLSLPTYFGNICLKFLSVFDLMIHRLLESVELTFKTLLKLLDQFGPLYKFHDHPITFLYTTLHYYESCLAKKPELKLKLTSSIIGSQKHNFDWYFTPQFSGYLTNAVKGSEWMNLSYFADLVGKLVEGFQPFSASLPACDWHFNEFSGPLMFVLHVVCVELLCLPLPGRVLAKNLLDMLYNKAESTPASDEKDVLSWINCLGLLFVSLPELFRVYLMEEVCRVVRGISGGASDGVPCSSGGMHVVTGTSCQTGCLLSLMHAYWHHANTGTLLGLPSWIQTHVTPLVKNELQLLFVYHLVGPLINRLAHDKPKALLDVVMELYCMLQGVDQLQGGMFQYSNAICDFLYHIKYMHIGDQLRKEVEKVIFSLEPPMKLRLRFLVPQESLGSRPLQGGMGPVQGVVVGGAVGGAGGGVMHTVQQPVSEPMLS